MSPNANDANMVPGCCTGICGNTECGGPVRRDECPGCEVMSRRMSVETNVACVGHGTMYCDELPNVDGEGCDYYTMMTWDCTKCHSCPGGWIADVSSSKTTGSLPKKSLPSRRPIASKPKGRRGKPKQRKNIKR